MAGGESPGGSGVLVDEELGGSSYAQRVGARLRMVRKQKGLSLQDVEGASNQEFKASVLGAYERGERAISVPRLQRLARFYSVPVDRLLPDDPDASPVISLTERTAGSEEDRLSGDRKQESLTIDLTRLQR